MNYRHAFHAGNFADLVKHAALLELLGSLMPGGPLTVIDTHAGRGRYDLAGPEARKSGEAEVGIVRLMADDDAPAEFAALKAQVRAFNPDGALTRYPGSPWLIEQSLRLKDHYIACELRPDEHAALTGLMRGRRGVETLCADGYATAQQRTPGEGNFLVLIDPPFERPDDYRQIVETAVAVRADNPRAVLLVWLPLKDLETFDGFLRELEDAVHAPIMVSETRLRPLTDPMKMNGCALVLIGKQPHMLEPMAEVAAWAAGALGDGGEGRAYHL